MNILYIGHDVSDYSRRLIEALAIGACGTNSHLCHKSYSSPELARQNLEDLRRSEVDALLIDLRPIMAPPIKFPQDDQKNFAQPYAAMGVPVIVLFDPRDESQRQLAEEIVMDAPQALALEKPRVTPSVRELGEKFVPSILNLVDQWKEQRKKTGAEMASLPAALRPKLELISQGQGGSEPALWCSGICHVTDADAALEKLAQSDYSVAIFVAAPDHEVADNIAPLSLSELDRVVSHVHGIRHCNSSLPMIVISERGEVLSEHAKVWDYEVAPASKLHDRAGFADVVSAANVYPRIAELLKEPHAGAVQTTLAGVPALQL